METIFQQTLDAWNSCANLRHTRRRLMRYTYGRQWEDIVVHPVEGPMTEARYFELQHRVPLTNNLLRSLVKSVVGRFRYNLFAAADGETPGTRVFATHSSLLPDTITDPNCLDELDARLLEEFLISGCAIQHISLEGRPGGSNIWIDNVSPARFFCNRFLDHRGSDLRLIGMIHEMTLQEMRMRFGRTRQKLRVVEQAFNAAKTFAPCFGTPVADGDPDDSFSRPSDPDLCRVFEVWTLRISFQASRPPRPSWTGFFFTADGTLLHRMESPFPHGSHPFIVKLYPLADGEVHPFIEDVIDQQRHINQIISLIDQILAHS
ncbi:MAG: hypothetical protein K2K55_10690, partial [Duncaniella sp.]|nr:hypothetical protein [Duncaniella sp.]